MIPLPALLAALALRAPAAGLPALPADIGSFLDRRSVSAPAPAGAPVDPWIAQARRYYGDLSRAGYVSADADFVSVDDADHDRSPGSAELDFKRARCTVYLNERLMKSSGFDEAFLFRFMIYHELQHCHLYAHPRAIRPLPGLSERASLMVSDLIQLDYFQPAEEDEQPRVNGYGLYHETFADIKALAVLLAQGAPKSRVDQIVAFRRGGGGMMPTDPHGTADALAAVAGVDWSKLDAGELDAKARELADAAMTSAFLKLWIRADPYSAKPSELLASRLQTPFVDLGEAGVSAKLRADLRSRLENGGLSSNPAWRLYARAAAGASSAEELSAAFFQARYGARPGELAAEDAEIRQAVSRLGD